MIKRRAVAFRTKLDDETLISLIVGCLRGFSTGFMAEKSGLPPQTIARNLKKIRQRLFLDQRFRSAMIPMVRFSHPFDMVRFCTAGHYLLGYVLQERDNPEAQREIFHCLLECQASGSVRDICSSYLRDDAVFQGGSLVRIPALRSDADPRAMRARLRLKEECTDCRAVGPAKFHLFHWDIIWTAIGQFLQQYRLRDRSDFWPLFANAVAYATIVHRVIVIHSSPTSDADLEPYKADFEQLAYNCLEILKNPE